MKVMGTFLLFLQFFHSKHKNNKINLMRFCFGKLKLERSKSGNQLNIERENRNFHGFLFLFRHSRWMSDSWENLFLAHVLFRKMWVLHVEIMLWFCVVGEQQMIVFLLFFERAVLSGSSIQKFWESIFDLIFCDILSWLPQIWATEFVKMGRIFLCDYYKS